MGVCLRGKREREKRDKREREGAGITLHFTLSGTGFVMLRGIWRIAHGSRISMCLLVLLLDVLVTVEGKFQICGFSFRGHAGSSPRVLTEWNVPCKASS